MTMSVHAGAAAMSIAAAACLLLTRVETDKVACLGWLYGCSVSRNPPIKLHTNKTGVTGGVPPEP